MAIVKQVVVSQIEVLPNGTLQVRFDKQVVDDGTVLAREFHRTVIEPGTDVDAQMNAVDEHLVQMGWPAAEGRDRIKRLAEVEHTPEAVEAYAASTAAAADAPS